MLKNPKHSLLSILMAIMLVLTVFTSLAFSKSDISLGEKNNSEFNNKWGVLRTFDNGYRQLWDSLIGDNNGIGIIKAVPDITVTPASNDFVSLGAYKPVGQPDTASGQTNLGMMISQMGPNEEYDSWIDTLMANGFTEFREIPTYQTWQWVDQSKAALLRNISKGAKYIWGVSSNKYDNPNYVITAENWPTFRQAILDAAQWAQDNGVYEFQIGNEEEYHIDRTTMTTEQIINNLKEVATEVQSIFTNGKVSYTCAHDNISDWSSVGKGDIDILASNVYMEYGSYKTDLWKTEITELVDAFGPDGTYLTEWGLNSTSILEYSTDEAVQAAGVAEMLDYIEASGMSRAIFFMWKHPTTEWGVLRTSDNGYRQLWDSLIGDNNGIGIIKAVPDITVTPASNDFGSVDINATDNPSQIYTITNSGSADLVIGTITGIGTAGQFKPSNDTASGQTIAPGESRTITIIFDPTTVGKKTAKISIPSNDPDTSVITPSISGLAIDGGA